MPSASRRAVSSLGTTARGSLRARWRRAGAHGATAAQPRLDRIRSRRSSRMRLPAAARTSASSAAAASRMRVDAADPDSSAATRKGDRAKGCVASTLAPRPLARRNWPAAPRALPMRSGKASASSRAIDMSSRGACAERPALAIRAQPAASLRMSPARRERSRRNPSSRSARSASLPPSPRSTITAAISAASSAWPSSAAEITMRASRGGNGSDLSRRPMAVMRPSASSASSSVSSSRAASMAAADGGSIQDSERGIGCSPFRAVEQQGGKIGGADLGLRESRQALRLRLVPQAIADAGFGTAGAAPALIGGGPRHPHRLQPRHAHVRLETRNPRQTAVDDDTHALDGDRRLGDRGREHHLAQALGAGSSARSCAFMSIAP